MYLEKLRPMHPTNYMHFLVQYMKHWASSFYRTERVGHYISNITELPSFSAEV